MGKWIERTCAGHPWEWYVAFTIGRTAEEDYDLVEPGLEKFKEMGHLIECQTHPGKWRWRTANMIAAESRRAKKG